MRKDIQGIYETKGFTKKKRTKQEISKKTSNFIEQIIRNCRGVKKCSDGINRIEKKWRRENFRATLGFKEQDIMLTKEQSVLKSVMDAFEGENMQTQYSVLGYKIDLYFHDYKLAIELDEKGHKYRNIDHAVKRQKALEKELSCEFIRLNPDEKNLIFSKLRMKYLDTSKNQLKNQLKSQLKRP